MLALKGNVEEALHYRLFLAGSRHTLLECCNQLYRALKRISGISTREQIVLNV
jgi:hypothetical protein